ncbi:hypothetical protein A2U01_0079432 [Trifolium medium]|uniref:Uncharacterized protein n=1 Tax=Trifolium medium TaxID=97028 RepID=A0A392TAV1_9FABA|nr:hypothetical protein [Trifolium medium]
MPKLRAENGPATRIESDITDNTLKHPVGCGLGLESTIVKHRA